jgi:hypothetical protein
MSKATSAHITAKDRAKPSRWTTQDTVAFLLAATGDYIADNEAGVDFRQCFGGSQPAFRWERRARTSASPSGARLGRSTCRNPRQASNRAALWPAPLAAGELLRCQVLMMLIRRKAAPAPTKVRERPHVTRRQPTKETGQVQLLSCQMLAQLLQRGLGQG